MASGDGLIFAGLSSSANMRYTYARWFRVLSIPHNPIHLKGPIVTFACISVQQVPAMNPFAQLLTEYMNRIRISNAELAKRVQVRRQTIYRWRHGVVERPRHREDVLRCASALGLTPGERDALLMAAGFQPEGAPAGPTTPPLFSVEEPTDAQSNVFVARERELEQLNAFLGSALAGQGQVVFVVGEAGSGKTALVQEFARRVQQARADLIVAGGDCNAHTGIGDPYLPFREILGLLTGDVEARLTAKAIGRNHARRLWSLIPHTIQSLVNAGPDLIDVLVPGQVLITRATATAPDDPLWLVQLKELVTRKASAQAGAGLEQSDLFEQYTRVLQALALQGPLLLMLDDLQWADAGSISLLFHLGRRLEGSRILIVGIYRPADLAPGVGDQRHPLEPVVNEFRRRFGTNQVDLDQTRGRQFVELLLDTEANRLDTEFRAALYHLTRGNALFTVEMLRGMEERGDLVQDEAGRWVEGPNVDWETLPARVEGVIEERIGRLPATLQETLKVASVEGESFTAEVVARIRGMDGPAMVQQLSTELGKQHRLVRSRDLRWLDDQRVSRYQFRHVLFQKYLYDHLDKVKRAHWHDGVGNTLEALYGDQTEDIAVQLARHFTEAGRTEKAVDYLLRAGNRAQRLSAHEEAMTHLTRGLELIEHLPDTPRRTHIELDLQMTLGTALMATQGFGAPDVKHAHARARELFQQAGEAPELPSVLARLWVFYLVRGELRTAYELGEQILHYAESVQSPITFLETHLTLGATLLFLGKLPPAQSHMEQAIDLYDPQQHHYLTYVYYGCDPGVTCLSYLAQALVPLGDPDQALKTIGEALALARELAHPYSHAFACSLAAVVHHLRREEQSARDQAEAAIALSIEHGFAQWEAHGMIMRGWALAAQLAEVSPEEGQEQIEEAIALIHRGLDAWRATGSELARAYYLALLADAYVRAGQAEQGLPVLAEALDVVNKTGERWYEAELHRLRGELLLAQGDDAEAETSFHKAIQVARRQQAKSFELRATVSLCQLWQKQGRGDEGRQLLAEIYGWFTEGFGTQDLRQAKTLLEGLS